MRTTKVFFYFITLIAVGVSFTSCEQSYLDTTAENSIENNLELIQDDVQDFNSFIIVYQDKEYEFALNEEGVIDKSDLTADIARIWDTASFVDMEGSNKIHLFGRICWYYD